MVAVHRRSGASFVLLLAACGATSGTAEPERGAERLRVTVDGRGSERSITSEQCWLLFVVRSPDGERRSFGAFAPEWSDAATVAGQMAAKIASGFGLPNLDVVEDHTVQPSRSTHVVLPAGFTLCDEPGCHFVCRRAGADGAWHPDVAPELRLARSRAGEQRFTDVAPSPGAPFAGDQQPAGWPPPGVR
jgi:hypothetical protein